MKSSECVGDNANQSQSNEALLSSSSAAAAAAAAAYNKRPVSMYETREGPHAAKSHDNRTANSMYQMNDEQAQKSAVAAAAGAAGTNNETGGDHTMTTNGFGPLPHSDDVKHRTEIVTRRIQELWSVMQEMTSNDVFVPGADRIRMAVTELTALFPAVIHSLLLIESIKHTTFLPFLFSLFSVCFV